MRRLFKRIVSFILIPLAQWYLKKERTVEYKGTVVKVLPGVFHPGLFYSTKFMLQYIETLPLANKKVLELGCGSGLISVVAAKQKAIVTSSDLSVRAIGNTQQNALSNHVDLNVVHSDLFDAIDDTFDLILINPPYYAKVPRKESEFAWYCGENFEYFKKLFSQLTAHTHERSQVVMVLTKGCDITSIEKIAKEKGFVMSVIMEKEVLFDEKDYLFSISRVTSP